MKNIQKILIIFILTMSIFASNYAFSHDHRNRTRSCEPYRDDPHDDDCESTKYSKLFVLISSGDVDLGKFVRGASYDIEPPDNQIEFTLTSRDAKRFNVVLSTNGSDLGNRNNVKIETEWRFSHDCGETDRPFVSGRSYFFWNKMILSCFITRMEISPTARSGNYSFEQVLTVNFLF